MRNPREFITETLLENGHMLMVRAPAPRTFVEAANLGLALEKTFGRSFGLILLCRLQLKIEESINAYATNRR